MKEFVIFTVYVICVISTSSGLKCYECDDVETQYSTDCSDDQAVELCDEMWTFCATFSTKNDGGSYSHFDRQLHTEGLY